MKKIFKLMTLVVLTMTLTTAIINLNSSNNAQAAQYQVLKKGNGSDLVYRGTSEKVYGLAEYNYPTSQFRAAWVSNFAGDFSRYSSESSYKAEITAIFDNMASMGMNAVIFHIRTHNNAYYQSDLNPVAAAFSNVNFSQFDPLEWTIQAAHERGLEFHAWLNPYRVSDSFVSGSYPASNPASNSANILTSTSGSKILNPGIPAVRQHVVATCMEVIERYDVDAIHFDDYFYISGVDDTATRNQYGPGMTEANFRRQQVDLLIESISDAIRAYNATNQTAIRFGIAPTGIYRNGSASSTPTYNNSGTLTSPIGSNTAGQEHYASYLYADTKKWVDEEWLDYILPQTYWSLEQDAASFAALTRWWSWVVENKKVDLYVGCGIYMSVAAEEGESGSSYPYWLNNEDEVKNQLLNAGMYDKIQGICFYKYSSLKKTQYTTVQKAVDLISNDYWEKRVPGNVVQQYASAVPTVQVSGLIYDNYTGKISWNTVSNVFGYTVYKVPKGTTVDTKNYDHLYQYIQTNEITVDDAGLYDYYVSSVNKANVVSTPVKLNVSESPVQQVISAINLIPSNVTLNDQERIETIRALYNNLSTNDKNLVTNYSTLVNAETTITKLLELKNQVENFTSTIDKHLNSNQVLPTITGLTWSYQNSSDSAEYNISTGIRLKNRLKQHYITLIATLSLNSYQYSHEVEFNVGLLKDTETGLFYRNDASAISPDDSGNYNPSSAQYIGWSEVTININNAVLFVAMGNYQNITDIDSTIKSMNWTSCAGVYRNGSSSAVTILGNVPFGINGSTYGYFIIGTDGKIKTVTSKMQTTDEIILQVNEVLVILQYLDTQITSSPWVPTSKLSVGTAVEFTDYNQEKTEVDLALELVEAIGSLPSKITLDDENLVDNLLLRYNNLGDEAKAYVTNYSVLEAALEAIEDLKQAAAELQLAKEAAILEIQNYADLRFYSDADQKLIREKIQTYINGLNSITSMTALNIHLNNFKSFVDQLEKIDYLKDARIEANNKLDEFVSELDLSDTFKVYLNTLIEEYRTRIAEATSGDDIDAIITSCKNTLNKNIISPFQEALDAMYAAFDDYDIDEIAELKQEKLIKKIEQAKLDAEEATTVEELEAIQKIVDDFYKTLLPKTGKTCKLFNAQYLFSFIASISLLLLLVNKKKH